MFRITFCMVFTCSGFILSAQEAKPFKKEFYGSWGYTRAAYTRSTIHLSNHTMEINPVTGKQDNYDFSVHNAVAHDRPDFDGIPDVVNITVPQYVFRLGFSLSEKWGIELNYDHTKYVVDDFQKVRVEGVINDVWIDQDTVLDPNKFLHFEHSDGANFWMINAVRRWPVFDNKKNFRADWVFKPGAGVVIPRTDVTLFGQRLNNQFHVAGWIAGIESGVRLSFLKHGFFEFTGKCSFASYENAFVLGKGHGKASHQFFAGQVTATIGMRFGS